MKPRTLSAMSPILNEARDRAIRELLESRDVHHLHIFDMDGTLAKTPGPSRENHDLFRYHTRSRTQPRGARMDGWWGDHRTLRHPFKSQPIEDTLKGYHAAKSSPNSRVVVMTGRVNKPDMRDAVSHTLRNIGVHGHEHGRDLFLKPPNKGKQQVKTADWKAKKLHQFVSEHPNLKHVHMWDDRPEHIEHFRTVLGHLGVAHTMHHVDQPDWDWSGKMPKTS